MTYLEYATIQKTLPAGFTARPVKDEDLHACVDMLNAYSRSQVGVDQSNAESLLVDWHNEIFNMDTDTIAVFNEQGQPVAYAEFWDMGEPHVRLFTWAAIHPDYWGRGLGSYILTWLLGRAQQNINKAAEGARIVLQQYVESSNQAAGELFTRYGFQGIRSSYQMLIEFDQTPQPAVVPEGIVIRSMQEGEERATLFAAFEAFKDHWGHVDEPFESYYKRHQYYIDHDPRYDPSLWFIALHGDEIVGTSLCYPYLDEDPNMGWVGTLGVLRPWRKHGLGLALLQHSFHELAKRGSLRAGLGVDASSLTGAVRLYERAGMHVWRKSNLYELELRPGKDLMTQSL